MLDNLIDQEKSAMLTKVMGYTFGNIHVTDESIPNLYYGANMALARMVRIWALKEAPEMVRETIRDYAISYWEEWMLNESARPWLDAIVETLIEAGLAEMGENFWHEYYGDVRADDLVSGTGIVEVDDE